MPRIEPVITRSRIQRVDHSATPTRGGSCSPSKLIQRRHDPSASRAHGDDSPCSCTRKGCCAGLSQRVAALESRLLQRVEELENEVLELRKELMCRVVETRAAMDQAPLSSVNNSDKPDQGKKPKLKPKRKKPVAHEVSGVNFLPAPRAKATAAHGSGTSEVEDYAAQGSLDSVKAITGDKPLSSTRELVCEADTEETASKAGLSLNVWQEVGTRKYRAHAPVSQKETGTRSPAQPKEFTRDQAVVVFGVPEAVYPEPKRRVEHDLAQLQACFASILTKDEQVMVLKAFRLGAIAHGSGQESKPRPLKVILGDKAQAELVLRRKPALRMTHPAVFFHPDYSLQERQKLKELRAELAIRLAKGERNLSIRNGEIVRTKSFLWSTPVTLNGEQ